jgi:hypothetical protein
MRPLQSIVDIGSMTTETLFQVWEELHKRDKKLYNQGDQELLKAHDMWTELSKEDVNT